MDCETGGQVTSVAGVERIAQVREREKDADLAPELLPSAQDYLCAHTSYERLFVRMYHSCERLGTVKMPIWLKVGI